MLYTCSVDSTTHKPIIKKFILQGESVEALVVEHAMAVKPQLTAANARCVWISPNLGGLGEESNGV